MGQAKRRGTLQQRVKQAIKKQAQSTPAKKQYTTLKDVDSSHNKMVVNLLNDPANGFYIQHKWTAEGNTCTIYAPCEDENDPNYDIFKKGGEQAFLNHLNVYKQAFGMVESASFNAYVYGEESGSNNPYTGQETYKPFGSGLYKLMIGVMEHNYKDGELFSDSTPFLQTAIFPLLQHGWEEDKPRAFKDAYGEDHKLNNLLAMLARSNFSTKYTSSFNTKRLENVENLLDTGWGRKTPEIKVNWLNHYEESYWMGRTTMYDNVKTLVGPDVTKDCMKLWKVQD